MVAITPKQRQVRSSKPLKACSNMQWCILFQKYCDKTSFEYRGADLDLSHEGRPVRLISIEPLETGVLCRRWQVCVEERGSGERWCAVISPSSIETAPIRELVSA